MPPASSPDLPAIGRRRLALCIALALAAPACSDTGPGEAEALAQIAQRIRGTYELGTRRLENLAYKSGKSDPDGRYVVIVDYELIANLPEIDMFGIVGKAGARAATTDERYWFRKTRNGWELDQQ